MKKILLLVMLLLFQFNFSQEKNLEAVFVSSKKIAADQFLGYDAFGFHYHIKDNVFFKTNNYQTFEYKNLSLGKIAHVDLENPLKIVLLYEDFNTIVTLDNQLNETQKINFSDYTSPIVVAATGMASQNRFWIYNSITQQIGLYDYLQNDFLLLTQFLDGNIKYYTSDFNYFKWVDEKRNWMSCDVFGKISLLGKVPECDDMQIINQELILFSKAQRLYIQNFKTNLKYSIAIEQKTFKSFTYKDQILSIFTTEGIINYKIILP